MGPKYRRPHIVLQYEVVFFVDQRPHGHQVGQKARQNGPLARDALGLPPQFDAVVQLAIALAALPAGRDGNGGVGTRPLRRSRPGWVGEGVEITDRIIVVFFAQPDAGGRQCLPFGLGQQSRLVGRGEEVAAAADGPRCNAWGEGWRLKVRGQAGMGEHFRQVRLALTAHGDDEGAELSPVGTATLV